MYAAVTARRTAYDTLTWQAPALVLTASAFLYTLIFTNSTARGPRIVASAINVVVSVLGYGLYLRATDAQGKDNQYVADLEDEFRVKSFTRGNSHGADWGRRRQTSMRLMFSLRLAAYSVINPWSVGLFAGVLVSLAVFLLAAIHPSFFS